MELKHKECFIPNIIKLYGLQSVSKYAREVAEFVNLYSEWRGVNRFPGLVLTHEMLAQRPEVDARGVKLASMKALQAFVDSGKPLGNPALEEAVAETKDPDLELALRWSLAVNASIKDMVHGVKPFPFVRECLEKFGEFADQMCVSATPVEALSAEWEEHDISRYVAVIAGQEVGSKKDTLKAAADAGYAKEKFLMIGDAPGDMKAARANGALFYPIVRRYSQVSGRNLRR
jgi:phosphoglycolate phosphatase-like HAD superfamily hydrolase